jgi:Photoprotection regulator fluorescence recovery protein
MESSHSSAEAYGSGSLREQKWSPGEKSVARKAFDRALERELDSITQEVKRRASGIKAPSELWELEDYLSDCRKEINSKYDYRYSMLLIVFGQLVRQGWISIDELRGLSEDKVASIQLVADLGKKWE